MRQMMRTLNPVVNHAVVEWAAGAAPLHAIWQAAIASAMVASGASPRAALRAVEQAETRCAIPGFEPQAVERLERAQVPALATAPMAMHEMMGMMGMPGMGTMAGMPGMMGMPMHAAPGAAPTAAPWQAALAMPYLGASPWSAC